MSSSANQLTVERKARLESMLAQERAEAEAEAERRKGGRSNFLANEEMRMVGGGMGLADRLNRSRAGLIRVED